MLRTSAATRPSDTTDVAGFFVACLCACHCGILPLLVVGSPVAAAWLGDERIETLLLGAALVIGLVAFGRGARRTHRRWRPTLVFVAGIATLLAGRTLEEAGIAGGVASMVAGSLIVAAAHLDNLRLVRAARRAARADACCTHAPVPAADMAPAAVPGEVPAGA